jgi:predicted ATPase
MKIQELEGVEFYNLIAPQKHTYIDLKKQINIITGFNGSGKSTCLSALHQMISMYSNNAKSHPRKDWASILKTKKHIYSLYNYTCHKSDEIKHDQIKKILSDPTTTFGQRFEKAQDLIDPTLKLRNFVKNREVFNINYLITSLDESDDEVSPFIKSILFMNENLSSSEEGDFEADFDNLDSFSKEVNIDKSLYSLLIEFSVQSRVEKRINQVYEDLLKNISNKDFSSIKEALMENSDVDELIKLEKIKKEITYSKNNLKEKPINSFMSILNSFFRETNREFFINKDGFLNLRCNYPDNKHLIIEWYSLSMGEKNLLSLLLLVFLNRQKEVLFLLDEPDLSMHISWQKRFIKTIAHLSPKSKFIISTHSPAMIDNSLDIQFMNLNAI